MRIGELWRYPVKSMQGERVDRLDLGADGFAGDRAYAVIDRSDGKVASAKNPRKWRALLACRAEFVTDPSAGAPAPAVRITLPDGGVVASDDPAVDAVLSAALGRDVTLASSAPQGAIFEETWPNVDGIAPAEVIADTRVRVDDDESVSDLALGMAAPPGTFFDLAPVHFLTRAALVELTRLQPGTAFVTERFRPNFVIEDAGAGFVENGWVGATVVVGETASVAVMMPTMRCVMTTLAQLDLPDDRAVLQTAAKHNRVEIAGLGLWACVGAYAGVASPGPISVDDVVSVAV